MIVLRVFLWLTTIASGIAFQYYTQIDDTNKMIHHGIVALACLILETKYELYELR